MISADKKSLLMFVIFISNVFSQSTLQQQFDLANKLFGEDEYFEAITELKRLQYFDKENQYTFQSNLLIGKSYKAGAKFDDAIKYFVIAEMNAANDDDYFASKILNARTNILRRTTKQAERILNDLMDDSKFISKIKETKYWQGWTYIFSDKWDKAYEMFATDNIDTALASFCKNIDEEMYNEKFAKYSSYLIPGLGQFYTGEYVSGALSLGWNILFGYLTINAFAEDRIFDGIMVGNFLWLRFYSGNFLNAEKFAAQKNLQISNKALDYLQFRFNREKP